MSDINFTFEIASSKGKQYKSGKVSILLKTKFSSSHQAHTQQFRLRASKPSHGSRLGSKGREKKNRRSYSAKEKVIFITPNSIIGTYVSS